jgi:hypothetical protein
MRRGNGFVSGLSFHEDFVSSCFVSFDCLHFIERELQTELFDFVFHH